MHVQEGQLAPDFTLISSNGGTFSLAETRGKNVVLYFYPKDMTPACTNQACSFRDQIQQFKDQDTIIIGISTDPVARHAKFIEKYQLPFELLSDEEHEVSELYGVWKLKKLYGKEFMGIERSTFFINKEGIVEKEWRKVRVANHIEEVLQYIQEHQK